MKKIICILMSVLILGTASFAQNKEAGKPVKKTNSPAAQKVQAPGNTESVTARPAAKLKKDGTPDMRVKENKASKGTAKPAGPLKKDGTPDMRYKANKTGAPTKKYLSFAIFNPQLFCKPFLQNSCCISQEMQFTSNCDLLLV